MRSPRALVRDIAGIRESELGRLLLMAAYLLLIITCYTTTKAVRDSLFVIEIGPSRLPYLYVLSALTMAAISAIYSRSVNRIGLRTIIRITTLLAIAQLILFWWLAGSQTALWFYVLYVWVSIFGAITASQAWLLSTHVFDAREARRLFGWIGVGGILGGICGGALARFIAPWLGTESLLLVCAGLMGLTVIILAQIPRPVDQQVAGKAGSEPRGTAATEDIRIFAEIRKSPHVSLLIALLVVGVIVEAFGDYTFKFIASQSFDSKDELTAFFGSISSYGGLLALVIQLVITSRFIKRFGATSAILLFPTALLVGFVIVAFRPVLWAASILRLADGGLSYSIHRAGMELLYVPVPPRQRDSLKSFIDTFVDRMGRATGGLLLLFLTVALSLKIPVLSLVASGFLVAWLIAAVAIRRQYVQAFRLAVEKKTVEPEALQIRNVDSATIDTLLAALSSTDDRRVLYALDLLGHTDPNRWRHHRLILTQHRSATVRARAIALLAQWQDKTVSSVIAKALEDPAFDVRVEAIRYLCVTDVQASGRLHEFLHHSDYRIVHAAIHCMAKYQVGERDLIDEALIESAANATGEQGIAGRTAAAGALALQWTNLPKLRRLLDVLLQDSAPEVVRQAIRTSGEVKYEGAIDALIGRLAHASFRREAREALLKFEESVLPVLLERLDDSNLPLNVRARIPKVLAFTLRQDIADALVTRIHRFDSTIDQHLMKALNIMRAKSTEIRFQPQAIEDLIRAETEKHGNFSRMLDLLEHAPSVPQPAARSNAAGVVSMLTKAIRERMEQTIEKTFRLIALIYPPGDVYSAYFTFSAKPALRASAVEFLDNLLEPGLKNLVVPVLEHHEDTMSGNVEEAHQVSWEQALRPVLESNDKWLEAIARDLAARLGVSEAILL